MRLLRKQLHQRSIVDQIHEIVENRDKNPLHWLFFYNTPIHFTDPEMSAFISVSKLVHIRARTRYPKHVFEWPSYRALVRYCTINLTWENPIKEQLRALLRRRGVDWSKSSGATRKAWAPSAIFFLYKSLDRSVQTAFIFIFKRLCKQVLSQSGGQDFRLASVLKLI